MKFEIEQVLTIRDRAESYVLARRLAPSPDWVLSDRAKLGGAPIEKWLDIPRAKGKDGNQRLDLFAFRLRDSAAASTLSVGQVVELEP